MMKQNKLGREREWSLNSPCLILNSCSPVSPLSSTDHKLPRDKKVEAFPLLSLLIRPQSKSPPGTQLSITEASTAFRWILSVIRTHWVVGQYEEVRCSEQGIKWSSKLHNKMQTDNNKGAEDKTEFGVVEIGSFAVKGLVVRKVLKKQN